MYIFVVERLINNVCKIKERVNMKKSIEGQKSKTSEFKGVELLEKAITICIDAHKDQIRKGDGKPYYIHPVMVALKLAKYGVNEEVLAAAFTHDILEDTELSKETIKKELGENVLNMVEALTNDDALPWKEKKLKYIDSVRNASFEVKLISVADKIHNLESLILAHNKIGKDIWTKFNTGKSGKMWFESKMLKMLKEYSHPLIDEYEMLIKKAKGLSE